MSYQPLNTEWTQALRRGEQPSDAALRAHLLAVHEHYAGFTESCASRCVNDDGRNSYQWLLELVSPGDTLLDLACGSGVLLRLARERFGESIELSGIDMSHDELRLARERMGDTVALHQGLAQELSFAPDDGFDVVLCHWAMTLMHPIEPVVAELTRVLRPGGIFGAIVDGDAAASARYDALNALIFERVASECPGYGDIDLGDARLRKREAILELMQEAFPGAAVELEPGEVHLDGAPELLARESVGFYYAAFVLSVEAHAEMMRDVERFFRDEPRFSMPINRLVVRT